MPRPCGQTLQIQTSDREAQLPPNRTGVQLGILTVQKSRMRPFKEKPQLSQIHKSMTEVQCFVFALLFQYFDLNTSGHAFVFSLTAMNQPKLGWFFFGGVTLKKTQILVFSHANRARFTKKCFTVSWVSFTRCLQMPFKHHLVLCCTKTSISFRRQTKLSQSTDLCSSMCISASTDFCRNSSVYLLLEMLFASLRERKI